MTRHFLEQLFNNTAATTEDIRHLWRYADPQKNLIQLYKKRRVGVRAGGRAGVHNPRDT